MRSGCDRTGGRLDVVHNDWTTSPDHGPAQQTPESLSTHHSHFLGSPTVPISDTPCVAVFPALSTRFTILTKLQDDNSITIHTQTCFTAAWNTCLLLTSAALVNRHDS